MNTNFREYEFTLISKADISDDASKGLFKKYEDLMTSNGGQIIRKNDWGTKKLAYPIKKSFKGRYTLYNFSNQPAALAEMERLMRIDENVLRYMTIKLGDNPDVEARKIEIAKEEVLEESNSEQLN